MWRRRRRMKRSQKRSWSPRCVIPLSTQTAESAAAEAPAALVALSTAWCHTHTHTHTHTQRWSGGYVHTLMKLLDLYRVVLVISQQGASGGSS